MPQPENMLVGQQLLARRSAPSPRRRCRSRGSGPCSTSSASIGSLSRSRPIANQPCSSSQKSRLNRAFRSAARVRSAVGELVGRPPPSRSGRGRAARRTRSPAPRTARSGPARADRRRSASSPSESFQPWFCRPAVGGALVLDVAVAVAVAELVDPRERAVGGGEQRVDLRRGGCPTAAARRAASRTAASRRRCRSRRCRRRATAGAVSPKRISWRMRPGSSSVIGLTSRPWKLRQRLQRAEREVGVDEHRHPRREQRVAAEQRHEPRRAGGDDGPVGVLGIEEPQRGEVLGRAVRAARWNESWSVVTPGSFAPPRLEARDGRRALDRTPHR